MSSVRTDYGFNRSWSVVHLNKRIPAAACRAAAHPLDRFVSAFAADKFLFFLHRYGILAEV